MTEKQKRFCDEYLIDLNATRAYKAAYPSVKKDSTAAAAAVRLLKNVKVQAYIQARIQDRQERTEITQDMVVRELRDIAMAEASDESTSELKYANKLKALELLGRHLGMFKDKVEVSGLAAEQSKLDKLLEHMRGA